MEFLKMWQHSLPMILYLMLTSTALKFYSDEESHEYSCNFQVEKSIRVDCACVDGLWILYDSCEDQNLTLSGDKHHCVKLTEPATVSKGVQLLNERNELAILEADGTVRKLTQDNAPGTIIDVDSVLVAGTDWMIVDSSNVGICLSLLEADSYCFFANKEQTSWEVNMIFQGCDNEYDYFVDPIKCIKIGMDTDDSCEHSEIKRRFKREADSPPGDSSGGNGTEGIGPDDEDYLAYNKSLKAGNDTDKSPVSIASGIMDYMGSNLDVILASVDVLDASATPKFEFIPDVVSRGGNPLNVTYTNPVYEFLDLSKRIMRKTCPPHYAKPEFLNLAVATFINLQQVYFKFPEQSFRPSGFRRVLNYLRACEAAAKPFNFTDANCDGTVDGNYSAFGQSLELTITSQLVDYSRDPIVETVWKVFFNAHSYCYPYFNKTLDHHRFASWMIPLFQNEMNALWVDGNTTEESLSGLFGNQVEVQKNLGYCAGSSRLESKYPWDLPRPAQIYEFGGATNGTNGTDAAESPPNQNGRKKRGADDDYVLVEFDDLLSSNMGTCLDSSKPLLCPTHIRLLNPTEEL